MTIEDSLSPHLSDHYGGGSLIRNNNNTLVAHCDHVTPRPVGNSLLARWRAQRSRICPGVFWYRLDMATTSVSFIRPGSPPASGEWACMWIGFMGKRRVNTRRNGKSTASSPSRGWNSVCERGERNSSSSNETWKSISELRRVSPRPVLMLTNQSTSICISLKQRYIWRHNK